MGVHIKVNEKTFYEWNKEGRRRFGRDRMKWRFVCPQCGHVQTAADFLKFKSHGARPESAPQECYGRYSKGAGCNWTSIGPRKGPIIIIKNDERIPVFDFYES